jgi:S-DNA-T family DNA segregation ATPase FtsK/SpoIIIE
LTTTPGAHSIPGTPGPSAPELPAGELVIDAPPQLEEPDDVGGAGGALVSAIPMLGGLGAVVLVAATSGPGHLGRSALTAGSLLGVTILFVLVQSGRQRRRRARRIGRRRSAYLRYLGTVRTIIRDAAARQRSALLRQHPDPSVLPTLAEERSRVWEREVTDPAFLQVRYGVCSRPLSLELVSPDPVPSGRVDEVDPVAAFALHRMLAVHRVQPRLPAWADLRALARIEICGDEGEQGDQGDEGDKGDGARSLARAMICSAAVFHSPKHLAIAVLASAESLSRWDWVKWLPHAWSARAADALGPRRMVGTDLADLAALLPTGPHVLLVVDRCAVPGAGHVLPPDGLRSLHSLHGLTLLDLRSDRDGPVDDSCLRLVFEDAHEPQDDRPAISALRPGESPVRAGADRCDQATAEALARRLAPLRAGNAEAEAAPAGAGETAPTAFTDLLGIAHVRRFDPTVAWRSRPARDLLRVPIGLDEDGGTVHLDLKESAQQGMGPHGLVIGATGSGKSELLRTLVLGLALTHSPEQLNLVLVDFKGGATFVGMSGLPHVSAVITNLEHELTLVDRMQDALSGEMVRRQELLRAAGNHASVRDYERARAAGRDLAPLPSLLIVVDEFSELLSAQPEFIDLFVAIGRLGRSLGLHLLLASQRLEEGRLRGLESHLSYRVGLRTFSAQESRTVLGVPDAYELPSVPGLGLLQPDRSTLVRFRAAYVSGPVSRGGPPTIARDDTDVVPRILPWTVAAVPLPVAPDRRRRVAEPEPPPSDEQESLLDVAVARMEGHGPAAHQVWLPPLDAPDTLDALMPDLEPHPQLGLVSRQWRARGGLTVPVGTVDRPREQRRDTLTVDLAGAGGHVAVVGGPRTGKSTLLRTLVAGLSLTTTPLESQLYVLDFGGGTFAPLRPLPHVAGLGSRSDPDVVRRIVAEVSGIVDRREAYFRAEGIDSVETYRTRRAQGRADDGYGDVYLVVDGWGTLRAEYDDLEVELAQLASRGLTFGFHVLTAASRWADYRAAVRDLMGTRVELRLGDPMDSEIDRRLAALVPVGRPGRGIVPERLHVLAALPRIDGDARPASLGDGVEQLVARVNEAWTGPPGPRLRLLPELLTAGQLLDRADEQTRAGGRLLIGVDEGDLAPVALDTDAEPHWLIFGDGRSGKSAALRSYVHEVMRTRSPTEAQIVLVDYRRSLLGEVPEEYLLHYLTSAAQAAPALAELASYLETRIPGPDVTPEQLRKRAWWSGAEVFLVVDDYDLVATAQGSPVQSLQPLLAQARDVGLHLVLARRAGGASRAVYEPVIQTLRDLAAPGLVLSGSPDEGPLIGHVRPGPAPAGRGRLVTRDRGVEVVQLAWRDPTL